MAEKITRATDPDPSAIEPCGMCDAWPRPKRKGNGYEITHERWCGFGNPDPEARARSTLQRWADGLPWRRYGG